LTVYWLVLRKFRTNENEHLTVTQLRSAPRKR
jgi:hypothetical protein